MKRLTSLLILVMAMAITGAAFAQVNSKNVNGAYNTAQATLASRGETIDNTSFTVPNEFVTHEDGVYRPSALLQVNVPVTSTSDRDAMCEIVEHHLSTPEADRARRIADMTGSTNATLGAGATATLQYTLAFESEDAWLSTDYNAPARFDVKVVCRGVMPAAGTTLSH